MTTIAWRPGTLAADTQASAGATLDGYVRKIAKRGTILAAASGDGARCQQFLDWFRGGMEDRQPHLGSHDAGDTAAGFIFSGDLVIQFHAGRPPSRMRAPFFAAGSGGYFATGALAAGASPEEAIALAIKFDNYTGGEVDVLRAR